MHAQRGQPPLAKNVMGNEEFGKGGGGGGDVVTAMEGDARSVRVVGDRIGTMRPILGQWAMILYDFAKEMCSIANLKCLANVVFLPVALTCF